MTQTDIKIKIYYDPSNHKFRTIRGISNEGYIVSEGTKFYGDAKFTSKEEIIEDEDFYNLISIEDIKTFPYSEEVNIGSKENPIISYIATKEPSIKKMNSKQLNNLLKISLDREDYEKAIEIRNQINQISC